MAQCTCVKCGRTMEEGNFYTYRDGSKTELCKKCLTLHVNPFEPDTFIWLLEKMDVPYIEVEWNNLRDKAFAANPKKVSGTAIFGKYLSKMKLNQYKTYRWADTERLNNERMQILAQRGITEEKLAEEEAELKARFDAGEISEAEYKTLVSVNTQNQEYLDHIREANMVGENNNYKEEDYIPEEELVDLGAELTHEDKLTMAMKWGRAYKPSEWVELESKYQEMSQSFDIQDSDTKGTLKLICKTYLKMNQAIDCGDMDSYQKLSRVYESLRKSAKFTAAQNKDQKPNFVDSVGELVAYCEKNGGAIPRHDLTVDYDIIDKVIKDLKEYTRSLVYEDSSLARQIEDYIKKSTNMSQQKKDKEEAKAKGMDYVEVSDEDIQDHLEMLEEDAKADYDLLHREEDEE